MKEDMHPIMTPGRSMECVLLANGIVEWENIRALMASRPIALDKCPGVFPLALGRLFGESFARLWLRLLMPIWRMFAV